MSVKGILTPQRRKIIRVLCDIKFQQDTANVKVASQKGKGK